MTAVGLASFARLPREGAVGAVLTYVRAIRTGRAATTVAAGPGVTDQPAVTTGTALAAVRASHGGVGAVTALAAVATTVHGSAGRAGHTLGGAGAAGATLPTGAWVTTIAAGPTVTILESHVAAATAAPVTGRPTSPAGTTVPANTLAARPTRRCVTASPTGPTVTAATAGSAITTVAAVRYEHSIETVSSVTTGPAGPAIAGVGPTRAAGPTGPAVTSILTGGTG